MSGLIKREKDYSVQPYESASVVEENADMTEKKVQKYPHKHTPAYAYKLDTV